MPNPTPTPAPMTAEQLRAEITEKCRQFMGLAIDAQNRAGWSADEGRRDAFVDAVAYLQSIAASLSGMAAALAWQPIETAPRDHRVTELQFTNGSVTRGHWMPAVEKWNCYGLIRNDWEFIRWFRIPTPPEPPYD